MRYTDIHQDVEQYSITESQPATLYSIGSYRELIYDTSPAYTLAITYLRGQTVEEKRLGVGELHNLTWNVTIEHNFCYFPNKEEVNKIVEEDNKKLEEHNKKHAKPSNCVTCIYYKDCSFLDNEFMECTHFENHRYTHRTTKGFNCSEYKEK